MFNRFKLKSSLAKYNDIIYDLLGFVKVKGLIGDKLELVDTYNNPVFIGFKSNGLEISKRDNDIEKIYVLIDENGLVEVYGTSIDERDKGYVVEKSCRTYESLDDKKILTHLSSDRYVLDLEADRQSLYSRMYLEGNRISLNHFESHMNNNVFNNNKHITSTTINSLDISELYDEIKGEKRVSKVYDLFYGNINEKIVDDLFLYHLGLITKDGFSYYSIKGYSHDEDNIVGLKKEKSPKEKEYISKFIKNRIGYSKAVDLDSDEDILKALTYVPTVREIAIKDIEMRTGMKYEEFSKLDFKDQEKLLCGHKISYDTRLFIDGIPIDENHILTEEKAERKADKFILDKKNNSKK